MNKKEITEKINKLNLDIDEFWVVGSASLVLRDIIKEANDIDIAVTNKEFDKIKSNLTYIGINHDSRWYRIDDVVECCVDEFDQDKVDIYEPFNLINLEYYYINYIKDSTRDKDIEKKELIEKELGDIDE